jgi:hypothetical protein
MAADTPYILKHRSSDGKEYTLTISEVDIQIERYSSGSLSGGSDTECGHTVAGIEALEVLLTELSAASLADVFSRAVDYDDEDWKQLHSAIQGRQTSYYLLD